LKSGYLELLRRAASDPSFLSSLASELRLDESTTLALLASKAIESGAPPAEVARFLNRSVGEKVVTYLVVDSSRNPRLLEAAQQLARELGIPGAFEKSIALATLAGVPVPHPLAARVSKVVSELRKLPSASAREAVRVLRDLASNEDVLELLHEVGALPEPKKVLGEVARYALYKLVSAIEEGMSPRVAEELASEIASYAPVASKATALALAERAVESGSPELAMEALRESPMVAAQVILENLARFPPGARSRLLSAVAEALRSSGVAVPSLERVASAVASAVASEAMDEISRLVREGRYREALELAKRCGLENVEVSATIGGKSVRVSLGELLGFLAGASEIARELSSCRDLSPERALSVAKRALEELESLRRESPQLFDALGLSNLVDAARRIELFSYLSLASRAISSGSYASALPYLERARELASGELASAIQLLIDVVSGRATPSEIVSALSR